MGTESSGSRGYIRGQGRHRDPHAPTIWIPSILPRHTGVPGCVSIAAGVVVAGLITTVAPSTTTETLRTDLVPAPVGSTVQATTASSPGATITSRPTAGVSQRGDSRASQDGNRAWASSGEDTASAAEAWTAEPRVGSKSYVRPGPAGTLRAGFSVKQLARGASLVFSTEVRSSWAVHRNVPLPMVAAEEMLVGPLPTEPGAPVSHGRPRTPLVSLDPPLPTVVAAVGSGSRSSTATTPVLALAPSVVVEPQSMIRRVTPVAIEASPVGRASADEDPGPITDSSTTALAMASGTSAPTPVSETVGLFVAAANVPALADRADLVEQQPQPVALESSAVSARGLLLQSLPASESPEPVLTEPVFAESVLPESVVPGQVVQLDQAAAPDQAAALNQPAQRDQVATAGQPVELAEPVEPIEPIQPIELMESVQPDQAVQTGERAETAHAAESIDLTAPIALDQQDQQDQLGQPDQPVQLADPDEAIGAASAGG